MLIHAFQKVIEIYIVSDISRMYISIQLDVGCIAVCMFEYIIFQFHLIQTLNTARLWFQFLVRQN